jgi:hypothetical protein
MRDPARLKNIFHIYLIVPNRSHDFPVVANIVTSGKYLFDTVVIQPEKREIVSGWGGGGR